MIDVAIESADNYRLETVKQTLKHCFDDLGFPHDNPLSRIIKPGDSVFIKPNWVASRWRESCPHRDSLYCVITHPNVIEAVTDYVADALCGEGSITIGDNPSIDADFEELMEFTGIRKIEQKYNVPVRIVDLRPLVCDNLENYGKKNLMVHQPGDPSGTVEINLKRDSLFYGIDPSGFRGVFDEREETIASHSGDTQLYSFAKSIYDADVYISIPKLKTHQKVGATLNLKGLVGTISNKNQLVHWRNGYPEINGDEYPDKAAYEKGSLAKVKHRGAWPGNDTIWRMVADLYKGMLLKDRRYLSIIDGIVGGEGQGPFCPTSKNSNAVIVGEDLLAVDCAAVRFMGIEPMRIPYLRYFLSKPEAYHVDLNSISVILDSAVKKDFFECCNAYADYHLVPQWEEVHIHKRD